MPSQWGGMREAGFLEYRDEKLVQTTEFGSGGDPGKLTPLSRHAGGGTGSKALATNTVVEAPLVTTSCVSQPRLHE